MAKETKKQVTRYYILFPKDTEEDCVKDNRVLGDAERMKKYIDGKFLFYNAYIFKKNEGFTLFEAIINDRPNDLHKIRIINDNGKHYTPESFLNILGSMEQII